MSNKRPNRNSSRMAKKPKRKRLTGKMNLRLEIILGAVLFCCIVLIGRLIFLHKVKGQEYEAIVLEQQNYTSRAIPFKRGDITDRNGNLLATSIKVYNVVFDAKVINSEINHKKKYYEPTIKAFCKYFDEIPETELRNIIDSNSESRYITDDRLKRLTYDQIKEFQNIMADVDDNPYVKGIWFEEEYKRNYPNNTLASATLGYSAAGNVGVTGIESYYNDYLNGTDGREYGYMSEDDDSMQAVVKNATNGDNLVSSIDVNLQKICEKYVEQWKASYNPKRVAVALANPNTGEILAMVDSESIFDPNNPQDISRYYTEDEQNAMTDEEKSDAQNKMWRNFLVSDGYEAGSTIKPFTIAGALEDGKITSNMTFFCDGAEVYDKLPIHCHKRSGHGTETVEQAIMNSCNDALMQISRLEGVDTFTKYQSIFGFGMKSGIDLPGEASCEGLLYTKDNMKLIDLACNSFGQNFSVNAMQMMSGFSSLINGGYYYKPHVIKQIVNSSGGVIKSFDKQVVKQTVTKETSDFLKQALVNTVEKGTGKTAKVEGYQVGGKTGTAQHLDKNDGSYLLSFLGFAPMDNPQLVCYAIVDEPDVPDNSSSSYACRLFSAVMSEALPYMNIYAATDTGLPGSDTAAGQTQTQAETQATAETQASAQPQAEQETTIEYSPSEDECYNSDGNAIDSGDADKLKKETETKEAETKSEQ